MSKVVRLGGRHWVWRFYDEDRPHDDHLQKAWAVVEWNDGRLLIRAVISWYFSPFPYEIRRAKLMEMIALPFSNKEECSEESSAENDGSESADDAQSARTHFLWIKEWFLRSSYILFVQHDEDGWERLQRGTHSPRAQPKTTNVLSDLKTDKKT